MIPVHHCLGFITFQGSKIVYKCPVINPPLIYLMDSSTLPACWLYQTAIFCNSKIEPRPSHQASLLDWTRISVRTTSLCLPPCTAESLSDLKYNKIPNTASINSKPDLQNFSEVHCALSLQSYLGMCRIEGEKTCNSRCLSIVNLLPYFVYETRLTSSMKFLE